MNEEMKLPPRTRQEFEQWFESTYPNWSVDAFYVLEFPFQQGVIIAYFREKGIEVFYVPTLDAWYKYHCQVIYKDGLEYSERYHDLNDALQNAYTAAALLREEQLQKEDADK